MLQASHWPAHVEPQQTPSTQDPLAHSPFIAHGAPAATFSTHAPAWQCVFAGQALPLEQPPVHSVAPHPREHACVSATAHAPAPLQKEASVAVFVPEAQLGLLHWMLESG
jgi:hypothetical protein